MGHLSQLKFNFISFPEIINRRARLNGFLIGLYVADAADGIIICFDRALPYKPEIEKNARVYK